MGSHLPVVQNGSVVIGEASERRQAPRVPTARMVRVSHDGCLTYARCRDISDTGVKLCFLEPIEPGERVDVAFSPRVSLRGKVIWVEGPECGIAFDREVDSVALLANTALEARAERDGEQASSGGGQHPPAAAGNRFKPGLNVVVMLESGREQRAMLSWTMDRVAGLMFQGAVHDERVILPG